MNLKFQKIFITVNPAITRKKALLFIEEKLFEAWDLQYGEPLTLMAGCRSVPVLVQPFPSSQPTIKLSFDTNQILSLPAFSDPISVTFHAEDRSINIGPFFAALINQLPLKDGTFGEMEKFYQEMKSYCHQQGFSFFLVGIQSLKEGVVEGYWPGQNGWQTLTLPIPNVFYNRIHSRRMEESPTFDLFTNELKSYSIPMFNGRFLSKFDVHELLLLEYELLSNLPDTILFNEKEEFFTFLENHSVIYLKPSSGSQGRNICRLTQVDGEWKIEQTGHIQNVHIADTNEKLYNALKNSAENKPTSFKRGFPCLKSIREKLIFESFFIKTSSFNGKLPPWLPG